MPEDEALTRLLAWLSPSFPVGGYTYSHGLEWAIDRGWTRDCASVTHWLEGVLAFGAGRIDADFLRESWMAVHERDDARLIRAVEWAAAMRGSAELALEGAQQGTSFLSTIAAAWPAPGLDHWVALVARSGRAPTHAIAVGIAASAHGLALRPTVIAYLHGFAANLVSAALRLIPLGQTDGQKCIAALGPAVLAAAESALLRPFDEIGSASPIVDLASMAHETQEVRLFRS
jgi:urease accessory protein